jgi:hypothetical protein
MNVFRPSDLTSISRSRLIASKVFGGKEWEKEGAGVYDKKKENVTVWTAPNCHIDTAWLWPFSVTRQKTARSWSTQLDLMERYPEHRFVASQTQQFKWLEEDYPCVSSGLLLSAIVALRAFSSSFRLSLLEGRGRLLRMPNDSTDALAPPLFPCAQTSLPAHQGKGRNWPVHPDRFVLFISPSFPPSDLSLPSPVPPSDPSSHLSLAFAQAACTSNQTNSSPRVNPSRVNSSTVKGTSSLGLGRRRGRSGCLIALGTTRRFRSWRGWLGWVRFLSFAFSFDASETSEDLTMMVDRLLLHAEDFVECVSSTFSPINKRKTDERITDQFNEFPLTSFRWQGQDKSQIVVHLCPYNTVRSLPFPFLCHFFLLSRF